MTRARKDWTAKQAIAAERLFMKDGGKQSNPKGPFIQWLALHALDALHDRFQRGQKRALARALRICAHHNLKMPEWVSKAFVRGYDDVNEFRAGTWEQLFGRAQSNGKHLKALRKRREKEIAVRKAIRDRHYLGVAIDDCLFEDIGKQFGIGKTLVKKYYAAAQDRARTRAYEFLADSQSLPEKALWALKTMYPGADKKQVSDGIVGFDAESAED